MLRAESPEWHQRAMMLDSFPAGGEMMILSGGVDAR